MPGYTLVPVDYQPDFEGVTLSKFQITMHGLDLGMGSKSIGITASQRGRRCLIGIDTNIEARR
jgi:hypothetical protein